MIDVVAGLIYQEGKLLACQRRVDGVHPLKWEFPGGKVEAGESDEDALRRELREELSIEIGRAALVYRHKHRYPGGSAVSLRFYRIDGFTGELQNQAFERIAWMALADLDDLDFLEGDIPVVRKLSLEGEAILAASQA